MEKTLSAYSTEHITRYFEDVKKNGLTEHGFPRLTANIGILIAHNLRCDLLPLFLRMMDLCCEEIPNKKAANDFSVREIIACILELKVSNAVDPERLYLWCEKLKTIDPTLTYNEVARKPDDKYRNWVLFTALSEFYRQKAGLCDSSDFIDLQICQQLQWFDENGMYRDNDEYEKRNPIVYDIVPRGLFTLLLDAGYRGPYYDKIDGILKKSALLTLDMLSPSGEIPFGGRSNQFLHNEPWACIIFEYEAKRYARLGERELSLRFKAAAYRALSITEKWLSMKPIRHIKNRYPTETGYGCEHYAYFDKYMITTASNLYAAYSICDSSIELQRTEDALPCAAKTSDAFHKLFMKGFGYGLEFDLDADPHYDANGLGRLHFSGAPSALCLSSPCPKSPGFAIGKAVGTAFSLCSAVRCGDEWLLGADEESKYELKELVTEPELVRAELLCKFKNGSACNEVFEVRNDGVNVTVSGAGKIGFALPAFDFDGEDHTVISFDEKSLLIRYGGYECAYTTSGKIIDLNKSVFNRNGRYRAFLASDDDVISVKIIFSELKNG